VTSAKTRGFTLIELAIVVGIIVVLALIAGESYHAQIPTRLLFGWYTFMEMNAASLQPNSRLMLEAAICTVVLGVGGHYFSRWLYLKMAPDGAGAWQVRWTVTGLGAVLLLFVAGIATIGITHQTAWLFTAKGPLIVDSWGPRFVLPEVLNSAAPARGAVHDYYVRTGRLPASAKVAGMAQADLAMSKHVKALRIEDDGIVVIELQHPAARDRVIVLTPTPRGKELEWQCRSNLERVHRPPACRD